jgi:DNA invertase Pin-like site-specific DNA recombinase
VKLLLGICVFEDSMRAIGYVRVSTDKQAEKGVSLEAQAEKIRAMAVVQGADLVDVLVDAGESAKSLNRPGMERLMQMVDAGGVEAVIIAKLDRLTRSVKDLAELMERFHKRGVSLVSVAESLDTGSAAGRLVLNIMTAVSQWEREAIGERTATAIAHKRAHGKVFNHVPFGYRRNGGDLVENADEQIVIAEMRRRRADGWTLQQIADRLNSDGVTPKQAGSRWYPSTVANIVRPRVTLAA